MRGKLPKEILERRQSPARKTSEAAKPKEPKDWKFWTGVALAVVGLVLGAIGLRARPTVSLDAPLDPTSVLSTPVVISNEGMMALQEVNVATYISKVTYEDKAIVWDNLGLGYAPPNQALETGERETVPMENFISIPGRGPVTYADITLIVSFKPAYMPLMERTRVFRFTTVRQADNMLRFQQQPANKSFMLKRYETVLHGAPPSPH